MHIPDGSTNQLEQTISYQKKPIQEPDPDQLELDLGDLSTNEIDDEDIFWQAFDFQNDYEFLNANEDYGMNHLFESYSDYVMEGIVYGMDWEGNEYLGMAIIAFYEHIVSDVWSIRKCNPEIRYKSVGDVNNGK